MVNVHALMATGVNVDGHREILGLDVASGEDGRAGGVPVRSGRPRPVRVQLVISDAHPGLVAAIGTTPPWPLAAALMAAVIAASSRSRSSSAAALRALPRSAPSQPPPGSASARTPELGGTSLMLPMSGTGTLRR